MTKPFKELRDKMSPEAVAKSKQMAARMTDHDALVRELREAMAQATPGPWAWESIAEKSNEFAIGQAWLEDGTPIDGQVPAGEWVEESIIRGNCVGMNESGHARFADAAYIALCSPANMATLLDALEEAQKDIAAHTAAGEELMGKCREAEAEAARLREQFAAHAIQCPQCQVAALQAAAGTDAHELVDALRRRAHDQGTHLSKDVEALIACALALQARVSALQGELAEAQRQIQQAYIEHDITAITPGGSTWRKHQFSQSGSVRNMSGIQTSCMLYAKSLTPLTSSIHFGLLVYSTLAAGSD
jgi:hypothetical protein